MSSVVTEGGRNRTFNKWVNNPVLEDYSLRYAPKSFRKWSEYAVATAALGGIAYMADQAIGGSLAVQFGFMNAFWGIFAAAVVIFLTGIPIAYYSARYNVDVDLLTRGAGFGYLGSTITSIIYASFTFIFFALEGSIMAQALYLYFGIPLAIGYALGAMVIIPLVVFGMSLLSKLQMWTQPLWLLLLFTPPIAVLIGKPHAVADWMSFTGANPAHSGFNPLLFGTAAGIALSLIAQIGEQVDYLRFMPDKTRANRGKWWFAVLAAGPGWVILGALKQWMGSFFASVSVANGTSMAEADQPIHMYVAGFHYLFGNPFVALSVATFFVLLSQVKINVTNAYSGSLSWSNFFSRVLHSHPGRVVYVFFNVGIALALMEANMFAVLDHILGFYSNVAVAWIGAVTADLVINKPILKLSPSYVEFKRAHLYNFNPVGFGSMMFASIVSVIAFFGYLGDVLQAYSCFLALGLAFVASPIVCLITQGKYYLARTSDNELKGHEHDSEIMCTSCGFEYAKKDMVHCPFHTGPICSLCCSLEGACHDMCKTGA
ncbi:membrane protein [Salinisphaera hydrothermalis]|uniref:Integral membrane sensor signal transduction histidine kinase n=1 Tax=Salinisphaera hydrothermalis (strain C41B8) TaxID=1304275 RepID=A0A084ILJ3_SALHC|nr:membrane protein [Salinisphaera hydrothermalis]KEZ77577.1 integral membrane sensor signal transduction histidine kinase [Salinisphaera hydrothermalis C41B8]